MEQLVYASSSSVYGSNKKVPYSTDDKVDNPVSLYAATKKSNELWRMPIASCTIFCLPACASSRFMVLQVVRIWRNFALQTSCWLARRLRRDFTHIDDIVEGVKRVMQVPSERKVGEDGLPPLYKVYNIGNSHTENLLDFVRFCRRICYVQVCCLLIMISRRTKS